MRHNWLIKMCTAAAVSLTICAPAAAQSQLYYEDAKLAALKWELGYLALSAVDASQTIDCLRRGVCKEANPLFGENPSTKQIILGKVGLGLAHFALFSHINSRNPRTALRVAQVSCVVQGSAIMLNARFTFK